MEEFNYFYGAQSERYNFVRIPNVMLGHKKFRGLSMPAKVLYAVLLGRMNLSLKNNWYDEESRVYIIFQIAEIEEKLGVSKKVAMGLLAELEKFGLIEKKRRGRGLPNILYVKNFMTPDLEKELPEQSKTKDLRDYDYDTSMEKYDPSEEDEEDYDAATENEFRSIENGTSYEEPGCIREAEETAILQAKNPEKSRKNETLNPNTDFRNTETTSVLEVPCREPLNLEEQSSLSSQEVPVWEPLEGTKTSLLEVTGREPLKSYKEKNYKEGNIIESNPIYSSGLEQNRNDMMMDPEECIERIKEQLEYDIIKDRDEINVGILDEIIELIFEVYSSQSEYYLIAKEKVMTSLVKKRFQKLTALHILYVQDCLRNNTTEIHNIKKYILAVLYNAPSTISNYYAAEVNCHKAQFYDEKSNTMYYS